MTAKVILLQRRKNAVAPPIPPGLRGRAPGDYCLKFCRHSFCLPLYSIIFCSSIVTAIKKPKHCLNSALAFVYYALFGAVLFFPAFYFIKAGFNACFKSLSGWVVISCAEQ